MNGNALLLEAWLNCDPFGPPDACDWDVLPRSIEMYAVKGGVRLVHAELEPLSEDRHRVAAALWDLYFPDHCPGSQVVFPAAVYAGGWTGESLWSAAAVVACNHFEHGETTLELARLHIYAEALAEELFGDLGDAHVAVLSPTAAKLVMVVTPPFWVDFHEEDEREWAYLRRSPREAIELARRGVTWFDR